MSLEDYSRNRIKEYEELNYICQLLYGNENNYVYKMKHTQQVKIFYIIFFKYKDNTINGSVFSEDKYEEIKDTLIK
jgi:hypothetical protein